MTPVLSESQSAAKKTLKDRARRILDPAITLLASRGVSPFAVTLVGLCASAVAAWVILRGSLFWGAVWVLFSGVCDVLDGGLARRLGRETRFGAFIDSTFDRLSEFFVFGGIFVYFADHGYPRLLLVVVWAAMGASFLVSYARARIEGLGGECKVGLLERPERFAILVVGLLLGPRGAAAAVIIIAFGAGFTVVERILHARRVTGGAGGDNAGKG
jgi:CDP-diacylglycerol--glycerol-3-phosphate 3-phosphatidyltransferase